MCVRSLRGNREISVGQQCCVLCWPDLIFPFYAVNDTAQLIKNDGTPVEQVQIKGGHGHLDGVQVIDQAGDRIAKF